MDFLTSCVRIYLNYRVRAIKRYATKGDEIQRRMLKLLVKQAANTEWGKEHNYKSIHSYEDFAANVPVGDYSSLKPYILRMMAGEKNILWKGFISRFVSTSGTTSDSVKFLPVSRQALRHCHLRGGRDATATYLDCNRESHAAKGYTMILSGSLTSRHSTDKVRVGYISAFMAHTTPPVFRRLFRMVPPAKIAAIQDIHKKYDAIADLIKDLNLTAFCGLPTWNISILEKAIEKAGAKNGEELWPNMELFAHGGMGIDAYRQRLKELFPSGKLHLVNNYNASEGFIGLQTDYREPDMTLMLDYEIFYEFIPMSDFFTGKGKPIPVWEVEVGVDYDLLMSTSSGLWRYDIGDVIRFTHKNPYKFVWVGRTYQGINLWGEELSVQQAEKALVRACAACDTTVKEYTVAPGFIHDDTSARYHQWLIEFEKEPSDMELFIKTLDEDLQEEDLDYEEFRDDTEGKCLQLVKARPNLFYDWLDSKGKLGGQHKIPRLSNKRTYIDELLLMNS